MVKTTNRGHRNHCLSLSTRATAILLTTLLAITTAFAAPPTKKKGDGKATIRVTDLRTERMTRPMSIDTPTPRLGWVIDTDKKDVMQTAYHLIVASTKEKAEALEGDFWDVEVTSDQSQWVKYAGKTLRGNTRCYWRVKVTTT